MLCAIWYYLCNFKNVKHPWKSVTFSKVAGFSLKVRLLHGCFSNGTKFKLRVKINMKIK